MEFEKIEVITTSILEETQKQLGYFKIPVPVEQIANELFQLNVKRIDLPKEQTGQLILETQTIQVNSKDKAERQKFTISHELGHYCLHRRILFKNFGSQMHSNRKIETEANTFAAYLLMPRGVVYKFFIKEFMEITKEDLNWLLKILNHLQGSDMGSLNSLISNYAIRNNRNIKLKQQLLTSIIPRIAQQFGVSVDAITWRLKDLGILSHFVTKNIYDSF